MFFAVFSVMIRQMKVVFPTFRPEPETSNIFSNFAAIQVYFAERRHLTTAGNPGSGDLLSKVIRQPAESGG